MGQGYKAVVKAQSKTWYEMPGIALEPRFMFDAAGAATAADAATDAAAQKEADGAHQSAGIDTGDTPSNKQSDTGSADPETSAGVSVNLVPDTAGEAGPVEVMLIDPSINDYQEIVAAVSDNVVVKILPEDATMHDIAEILAEFSNIDALHIVSHGSSGSLELGGETITTENIEQYTSLLGQIGNQLDVDGDILLYGCDISEGEGSAFVQKFSDLTGADVAASENATGSDLANGDWVLETSIGSITTQTAVSGNPNVLLAGASPVISNLNGDSVAYAEGDTPVKIDNNGDLTLTDGDTSNFNGGSLVISFTSLYVSSEDQLGVDTSGTVSTSKGFEAGGLISIGSDVIAVVDSADLANGQFVFEFTNKATTSAVQTFIRALQYQNTNTVAPDAADRDIGIQISDGDNNFSAAAYTKVVVSGVNDAPTLTGIDATRSYSAGGAAVVIDADMTISDGEHNDNGNYTDADFVIERVGTSSGNPDDVFTATGQLLPLQHGRNLVLNGVTIGSVLKNTGGQLWLTFNQDATQARVNEAIQSIAYSNASSTPPTSISLNIAFADEDASEVTKSITIDIEGGVDPQDDSGSFIPPVSSDPDANSGPVQGVIDSGTSRVPDAGNPVAGAMRGGGLGNTGGAVETAVTGRLGDSSPIGSSGTPVSAGLAEARLGIGSPSGGESVEEGGQAIASSATAFGHLGGGTSVFDLLNSQDQNQEGSEAVGPESDNVSSETGDESQSDNRTDQTTSDGAGAGDVSDQLVTQNEADDVVNLAAVSSDFSDQLGMYGNLRQMETFALEEALRVHKVPA